MSNSSRYKPPIYPAYTFSASPTYFAWVKITAADIQQLTVEPGFHGQGLYFYLNHPIRYVSLTAPIVAIEDVVSRYILLTLDDGSGATIAAKVKRLAKDVTQNHSVELASNTTVTNLSVSTTLGAFDVTVDGRLLDIGSIVKIKATIEEWRGCKQLDLKRISLLQSTSEEIREWQELTRWKNDILRRPWYLGRRKLLELQAREENAAQAAATEMRRREEKRLAHMSRMKDRNARAEERERRHELKRRQEEVIMNKGALI